MQKRCWISSSYSVPGLGSRLSLILWSVKERQTSCAIQRYLDINLVEELGVYLGVPITAGVPKMTHFEPLRSRIMAKLNGWKTKSLSLAGRLCLINYSLLPKLYHFLAHCHVQNSRLCAAAGFHLESWARWEKMAQYGMEFPHGQQARRRCGHSWHESLVWYDALSQAIRVLTEPGNSWVRIVREKYNFKSWLHRPYIFGSLQWYALWLLWQWIRYSPIYPPLFCIAMEDFSVHSYEKEDECEF